MRPYAAKMTLAGFREPGGVLFEIARVIPGFAIDESVDALGRDLKLPGFPESRRSEIEGQLPLLETATDNQTASASRSPPSARLAI